MATTGAQVTTQVDEHTEADITSASVCEMVWTRCVVFAGHIQPISQPNKCDAPATWIVRTLCSCGHHETWLYCDPHKDGKDNVVFLCPNCGDTDSDVLRNAERI